MVALDKFDEVFHFNKSVAYHHDVVDNALKTRRKYDGQLFIDRLFKVLGVKDPSKLYPPKTNADLRALHRAIHSTSSPDQHKQTLFYYLLKDCDPSSTSSSLPSMQFASRCSLPEKYRLYIDGLWALDNQDYTTAMEYLTEPSLLPTFSDEILYALIKHTGSQDRYLVSAYYNTVHPPLTSENVLNAYFGTLCASNNLSSALFFARARDSQTHRWLLTQLIISVMASDSSASTSLARRSSKDTAAPALDRSSRALALLSLPFTLDEEAWFEECLLTGEARNYHGARDTVMVRRMATGQLSEKGIGDIEAMETLVGRRVGGINWSDIKGSLEKAGMTVGMR